MLHVVGIFLFHVSYTKFFKTEYAMETGKFSLFLYVLVYFTLSPRAGYI